MPLLFVIALLVVFTVGHPSQITVNWQEVVMAWGMIMAMFSVGGMLVLIFAQPQTERYQAFGQEVVKSTAYQYSRC